MHVCRLHFISFNLLNSINPKLKNVNVFVHEQNRIDSKNIYIYIYVCVCVCVCVCYSKYNINTIHMAKGDSTTQVCG